MSKIGIGVSRIPMFFFFFILIILNFSRRQVVCQSWQEYRQTGNPNLIPFMTSLVYSGLSNVTNIFLGEVSNKLDFCVKDVNAEWNVAFNYSSDLGFLESCIERTRGDIVHRLCTAAEIKFYFRSFLERGSKSINSLEPNRNCNLTTWNPGCEPGWACGIGLDQKIDLKNSKDIPSRTRDCQSCCAGFFCPRGLTCMIPCPLGAYCPLAELNETTGICDPYSYPLPPGHQNHTCGGADTWADIRSSSNVFCSAGSYCPSTVKKFPCSSGHYCRTGSTSQKRCFKLTSCNSNTATQHLHVYGAFLIAALSTLLLIIYSCSDQVLSIRERRQAKSRETAARSAKESAHARERWKAARAIAKKGVLGLQRQMSRTFSLKSSGTQPEEMIMLDQASAGPDDPIFSTDISVASEEPSAAAKTNNKEPSNHTKAVHSLDEHSESYDSSSSFESGDKHIKRQKPKVRHLHTNTQIFEYAYGKLEKEKALEQQNKNMSFSGVINMATRRVTSTRPVIEVAFKDLTLTLKGKHKHLLRCVTGKIRPGRVSAVMGPSGAGKTTFLNALAGKATGCTMTGLILINGRNESIHSYKKIIGFVPQDDIVHGNLTVEENLQFSAKCRLSADMPKADKVLVVERVIESLGLQAVRDSLVGTVEQRGISGGQRKRVNVGLEMVMEPSLLILDEPTSGLDSSSSHLLLRALRREALEGVNICMVVHQPSYTLFKMFDDLILLAKGGLTVYHGPVRKVEEYFASLGIIVPDRVNPPDHFIDILEGIVKPTTNIDMTQLPVRFMLYNGYPVPPDMQHCGADIASTSNYRDTSDVADRASAEDDDNQSFAGDLWQDVKCNVELRREHILLNFLKLKDLSNRKTPGAYRQYRYYLGRVSKQRLREAKVQAMDLLILLLAGASLGIIAKVSDETFGAAGYTYTVIAVSLLCKIAALRSFSLDKLIYWRESASGMSSLAYFLSKDTIDLFSILVKPVVYLSMFYFFNSPRSSFIDNYTVLVCLVYCVTGIGYAFSIFLHPGPAQLASVLLPVVFTLIATQPRTGYMKVIPNFCYPKWALEAFVISNAKRYSGVWLITRCGSLMKTGYDVRAWNRCLGILLIYGAVSRVLAYICMVSTKKK